MRSTAPCSWLGMQREGSGRLRAPGRSIQSLVARALTPSFTRRLTPSSARLPFGDREMSWAEVRMAREIAEAPQAVAGQVAGLAPPIADLVARLKRHPPQVVVTCARGSSAHAATYGKHLIERTIGAPVAEAAPNIASVYGRHLNLKNQLFLAISQSGRSDDLIDMALSARSAGALTVAMVNATDGPLTRACDIVLPIGAGPELSVAASKTFVATLSALQRLVAAWTSDAVLARAVDGLADRLAKATALDWSEATDVLSRTTSLVTIGRG